MLRIIPMKNSAKAKDYYREALCHQDAAGRGRYYSEHQEVVGHWGGKGATRLGLVGRVAQEEFEDLCDNLHPVTGVQLTPVTKENRRVGYDMNWHAPKSLSLYHGMTGDVRIEEVVRESCVETMNELEGDTLTRVRLGGQDTTRKTGALTWASFNHFTARPVGGIPDPHFHSHVVCFNHTWDAVERRYKAFDVSEIQRDATYYEAAFHNRIAKKLKERGFAVERTADRWELAGISEATLAKFQERTNQIEKVAEERGITSDAAKDALGAETRENKAKDFTRSELREIWNGRLTDEERAGIEAMARQEVRSRVPDVSLERAFDYARKHGFERNSVISEKRFMAHVLRHGVGAFSVEEVNAEARRSGNGLITREIGGERLTTTPEVLREEQKMLAWAREGKATCHALALDRKIRNKLLSDEQKAAVLHVWNSGDRVMMVRGGAGVGKTTLVAEAVKGVEKSGTKVCIFAPSADASRGTLRGEGFKDANTLASLLTNPKVQEQVKGSLLWIDESGQIGTRDLAKLFAMAERQDCRILLTGDTRQHGPVARGDAMRLLEHFAGIVPAEVAEIRRQEGAYKDAVKALSEGDAAAGFAALDKLGFIREIEGEGRHKQLAADYVKALGKHRGAKAVSEAICIAPTHAEGAAVTAEIREHLKSAKRLGEERRFGQLKKTTLTEAERGDAVHYHTGQIVQLTQNIRGFTRAERLTVIDQNGSGGVEARRADGEVVALPLAHADRFLVFNESELAIAKGETVRITNNGFTAPGLFGQKHRLDNGSLYTVKGFTKEGDIKLSNGWIVPKDFGHLDFGYCQTSYSSQSKSVKRCFIAQGSESLPATDLRQFYVSVSRGKLEASIYTDSKADLLEAVRESEQRLSAVELMANREERPRNQAASNRHLAQSAEARAPHAGGERRDGHGLHPSPKVPPPHETSREAGYER